MYKLRIIAILVLSLAVALPAMAQRNAKNSYKTGRQNAHKSKVNSGKFSSETAKAIVFDEAVLGLSSGVKECIVSNSAKGGGKSYIFKSTGHSSNLWQLFDADKNTFRINRGTDGFISSANWTQNGTECTAKFSYTPSGVLNGWEKVAPGSTHSMSVTLDGKNIPVSSELTITSQQGKIIIGQQYSNVKLDKKGNWISRNVSETMTYIVAVNGQTHSESRDFTETRRISYFAAPKKKAMSSSNKPMGEPNDRPVKDRMKKHTL